MSRPYAEVIGDPISHSKSPLIQNFWLKKRGIDAEYRACHVRPEELADYCARRRGDAEWRGCNVTIPHKQAVMTLLDEVDERAQRVGAVNTVMPVGHGRLAGANTDVDGIAEAVTAASLAGRTAAVIGAGGAARAAFVFLAGSKCSAVRVIARSPKKAADAAQDCGLDAEILSFDDARTGLEGASLLVNATQLGMARQPPMPGLILDALDRLAREAVVFDMVYAPLKTQLLDAAKRMGLGTSDGLVMLVGQAATAFEKFFGEPAPRQYDEELRRMLIV
jgi:shikimate dehydrogenase